MREIALIIFAQVEETAPTVPVELIELVKEYAPSMSPLAIAACAFSTLLLTQLLKLKRFRGWFNSQGRPVKDLVVV